MTVDGAFSTVFTIKSVRILQWLALQLVCFVPAKARESSETLPLTRQASCLKSRLKFLWTQFVLSWENSNLLLRGELKSIGEMSTSSTLHTVHHDCSTCGLYY